MRLWVKKAIKLESRAIDDCGFQSAIFTIGIGIEPHACATLSDDLAVEFEDGERLKIPIRLNVVPETYLIPQQIYCGTVLRGRSQIRSLRLISKNQLNIKGVECDRSDVSVKFIKIHNSAVSQTVELSVTWNTVPGCYEIKGTVLTDHPKANHCHPIEK